MEKAGLRLASRICIALALASVIFWLALEIMQAAGYVELHDRFFWASGLWVVTLAFGVIGMSLSSMAKKERE